MKRYTLAELKTETSPSDGKVFRGRIFQEEKMYVYLEDYALQHHMKMLGDSLRFAAAAHEKQFRKGQEQIPYINHPLTMTCQLIAMGIEEEMILSASILHDVCEDCPVKPEELPVTEETREAVRLLTKPAPDQRGEQWLEEYYRKIAENRIALLVKIADRCNNVSQMTPTFSVYNMKRYGRETFDNIIPLLEHLEQEWPQYASAAFLFRYQLISVLGSVQRTCLEVYKSAAGTEEG